VSAGFQPTAPDKRGWIVYPLGEHKALPYWVCLLALVPALLLFILLFMEVLITRLTSTLPKLLNIFKKIVSLPG